MKKNTIVNNFFFTQTQSPTTLLTLSLFFYQNLVTDYKYNTYFATPFWVSQAKKVDFASSCMYAKLESEGYKYIIGARIKNETDEIKQWILSLEKYDGSFYELCKLPSSRFHASD